MERPYQAVILAGGRGTRLRPLTDTLPKPMIPFHGRPFLDYLIEMFRERGFRRILLLLGYLPEKITDYFGDGRKFGVKIEYAISDAENETGRRLKLAASRIEPRFLFAYCDNYWPMPFDAMMKTFSQNSALAQLTVYRNRDGYTRSNLAVDNDGFIKIYDKTRMAPTLSAVDIGFMIADRAILDLLPDNENASFEATVYPKLIASNQLYAYETDHRYYSVGTIERLAETARFLARQRTILIDRDGVLNQKAPPAEYIYKWDDWIWLPGAKEALRLLHQAGYRVIIVSNQAGIARGLMTGEDVDAIHARMKDDVAAAGGRIDAIYYCPHGWDDGCICRKPAPGLLFQAQREFALDLSRTVFIGDDSRDAEAARHACAPFISVDEKTRLLDVVRCLLGMT